MKQVLLQWMIFPKIYLQVIDKIMTNHDYHHYIYHFTTLAYELIKILMKNIFTDEQRLHGAIIFHIIAAIYFFTLLAVVCNDYFLPSVECICDDLAIPEVRKNHIQLPHHTKFRS